MITIEKPILHEKLVQGTEKAKNLGRPVLVSVTTRIKATNPLAFFYAGRRHKGTRVFWSDPQEQSTMVGIGTAVSLETNRSDRFQWMERQWRTLLEGAIIPNDIIPGTGPVLFGGFSFDPLKKNTSQWESFPSAKMTLPKYLLTLHRGETWLSIHFLLHADDDPFHIANQALVEQKELIAQSKVPHQSPSALQKEEIAPEKWLKTVEEAKQAIRNGELEKIVLARELRILSTSDISPEFVLDRLQTEQPLSYVFAFESDNDCFIGATPERLVKRQEDDFFFTCLAGSMKRGKTEREDDQLGTMLFEDKKNRHEHQLVVDMIKTTVEKLCQNVVVPDKPVLCKMRDIQHLHTPIHAKANGHSLLAIASALHPTPALGGFPQDASIEKIREMEALDRGWYASPVGWIDHRENGEFAIGIRSALLKGKQASLFAGCGIVVDSDPISEYHETNIKFKPMLSALGDEIR